MTRRQVAQRIKELKDEAASSGETMTYQQIANMLKDEGVLKMDGTPYTDAHLNLIALEFFPKLRQIERTGTPKRTRSLSHKRQTHGDDVYRRIAIKYLGMTKLAERDALIELIKEAE